MQELQINPREVAVETMASGHLTLILKDNAGWHNFDGFAQLFTFRVGGTVKRRADSPVERVWTIVVDGVELRLCYDDWHDRFELDALDDAGDAWIRRLAADPPRLLRGMI